MIQATEPAENNTELDTPQDLERLPRYALLLQATQAMLQPETLVRLLPPRRSSHSFSPILETERIAIDFLVRGGKRFRPFVTLAAYDALAATDPMSTDPPTFPLSVQRAIVAIEAFHKASLVHDDIEDDDLFRYGFETLHRQHDVATAINIGDYLVGLGYRWVTESRSELGASCSADVLHRLMDAHVRLSEGQGAELAWRKLEDKFLSVDDARAIYDLKTVPAFEAALYVGVRLATPAIPFEKSIEIFSRELGLGFQILNDLKDWQGDPQNKVVVGQDVRQLRPTMLLALAIQAASEPDRDHIREILAHAAEPRVDGMKLGDLFAKYDVVAEATRMVDRHRSAALQSLASVDHPPLRSFLGFLVRQILSLPQPNP